MVIISYLINHVWMAAMWDTVPSGFQTRFLPIALTGRNAHVHEVFLWVGWLCYAEMSSRGAVFASILSVFTIFTKPEM